MLNNTTIDSVLSSFSPISLEQMKAVRLMDRIDTKYVASTECLTEFLNRLNKDFFVQETGGKRVSGYFTVYYDTSDLQMYRIHQSGKQCRQKIRVRTYLDTDNIFLEIKRKNNKARTKKVRIECNGDILANSAFIDEKSNYTADEITSHLENNFKRITLVNKGYTERLTIDFDLNFHNARTDNRHCLDNVVIIELKQEGHSVSTAKEVLRQLRIKPTGFSKYCVGCAVTDPEIKINRIKAKLRFLDKITQTTI